MQFELSLDLHNIAAVFIASKPIQVGTVAYLCDVQAYVTLSLARIAYSINRTVSRHLCIILIRADDAQPTCYLYRLGDPPASLLPPIALHPG